VGEDVGRMQVRKKRVGGEQGCGHAGGKDVGMQVGSCAVRTLREVMWK